MRAVIMAGGQGTRLRPLTSNQPKPMLPIANRPIMEHIVNLVRGHGITETIATVQFLGRMIRSYFGNGEDLGVHITYATEETPLGTAGSVKNAQDALTDDTFVVISGDALTDIDLTKLVGFHKQKGSMATLCLKSVPNPLEFGIVIANEDGSIERFLEKPNWGQVFSDTINTGIYVLEPAVFDFIPEGEIFDFSQDLFPILLDKGLPMFGYVADEYWCDVGHFDSYIAAHRDVLEGKVKVDIPGFKLKDNVWLGEGAEVDPSSNIQGPAVIGENCRVEDSADIREFTVLGNNVMVKEGAFCQRAVVHDNAYIGPSVNLRGCVVGKGSDVRRSARLEDGVIVGDDCSIGENAVVNPGVRIYPFKTVEAGAIVTSSIIWESSGVRTLFGAQGVSGLINVDVTPETAVRLAMAYASTLKKGSVVTTSRDTTRAARALKRAVVAGINMAGVHCHDLELSPEPVTRYYIHTRSAQGGMTLRTSAADPQSIQIRFVSADGSDLGEDGQRKIERVFYRSESRRAYAGELGELHYPPRAWEFYVEGLLNAIDFQNVRDAKLKIVVDYGGGPAALVLPAVLGRMGCQVLSVNAAVDESIPPLSSTEITNHLSRLSDLVVSSGSDLGVLIDPTGEQLWLVDDLGKICDQATTLLLALQMIPAVGSVALPVSASDRAAQLAENRGLAVVWTKSSLSALQQSALDGVSFAGNPQGALIFPDFLPSPDALMSLAKICQHRALLERPLSSVTSALPATEVVHEVTACPWERKGALMREMVESAKGDRVVLIDGVKVHQGDDWILVLPDPEQPLVHVYAESPDASSAHTRAAEMIARIRNLLET